VAAIKYGINTADLKGANKLYSQVLFPGTLLKLPPGTLRPLAVPVTKASAERSDVLAAAAAPLSAAEVRVFDTAGVWDGEAGFMSLKAGAARGGSAPADDDAPCTWVGTLFSPSQDCAVTGASFNVRLVEGDALAFRLIVAEWDGCAARGREVGSGPAADDDVSQDRWFTPALRPAGAADEEVDSGRGGAGALLYCSRVMRVEKEEGKSEQAYRKIEFQLPLPSADTAYAVPAAPGGGGAGGGDECVSSPAEAQRAAHATEGGQPQVVRVSSAQTVLLALCTEGVDQGALGSSAGGAVPGEVQVRASVSLSPSLPPSLLSLCICVYVYTHIHTYTHTHYVLLTCVCVCVCVCVCRWAMFGPQ
jgi:hypothetical protein